MDDRHTEAEIVPETAGYVYRIYSELSLELSQLSKWHFKRRWILAGGVAACSLIMKFLSDKVEQVRMDNEEDI